MNEPRILNIRGEQYPHPEVPRFDADASTFTRSTATGLMRIYDRDQMAKQSGGVQ